MSRLYSSLVSYRVPASLRLLQLLALSLFLLTFLQSSVETACAEKVADCCCELETIEVGNDVDLYKKLQKLRTFTFFTVFKVNLLNDCPFWRENPQCSRINCAVCGECKYEDLPNPFKIPTTDPVDRAMMTHFKTWSDRDDSLWIVQDTHDLQYINMTLNPEGYTGYEGFAPHRIWSAIYDENCFSLGQVRLAEEGEPNGGVMLPVHNEAELGGLCYEQRVFFRLLSGLHSSISSHITNSYPIGEVDPHVDMHASENSGLVGPNLAAFNQRVGNHPERVTNLYFAFVFMLRALNKASNTLRAFNYDTGYPDEDRNLRAAIDDVLSSPLVTTCSSENSFDERLMFSSSRGISLKKQLKGAFRNISRIMDCVGCEKCKLHGKLQILGLGTALKILFTPEEQLKMERNEIMAFIVTTAKFSNALRITREMEQKNQAILWSTGWRRIWKAENLMSLIGVLIALILISIVGLACRKRGTTRLKLKSKEQ